MGLAGFNGRAGGFFMASLGWVQVAKAGGGVS